MSDTHDLRRGDDDAERKWGGSVQGASRNATAASDERGAVAATVPVRELQRCLRRAASFSGPSRTGFSPW